MTTPRVIELHGLLDLDQGHRVARAIRSCGDRLVHLLVDSPGGKFGAAVSIMLEIEEAPSPVVATVTGEACSAAAMIVLGCDRRRICRDGQLMLHFSTDSPEHERSREDRKKSNEELLAAIGEYVPATRADLLEWMVRERYFTATEALSAGLVDSIAGPDLPVFLREPPKRPPSRWLREWRDDFERMGLR